MRKIAFVFGSLAAAGAGTYLVVYLYRWQWQRALLCGVLLLVIEVMLLGLVMLGRLTRIEERLRDSDRRQRELAARQEDVLARLREAPKPEPSGARFRWLEEPAERTYVFVPVLMVTGVVLSGLAWVVQRIASATARPAERRLAGRLAVLTAPDPAAHDDLEDLPSLDAGRPRGRTARGAAVGVVGLALLGSLVVGLADLTQTRKEGANESKATSVLVQVDLRGTDMSAERRSLAAQQIWERCRDSTSVPLSHAALGDLGDGVFAGVVRPALTDHDQLRLRGCLEDATLERAHLTVVGMGDADDD
jgi:MFS family permease